MFSFASGGTSIGGSFTSNSFRNSPVSFGGSITQGDMTTGSVDQTGNVASTGATSQQTADISIPPIPALMILDTENTGFMAFGKSANDINWRGLYDYAQSGGDALGAIGIKQLQELYVGPAECYGTGYIAGLPPC